MARTQQQRREETIARLLDASIETIVEVGYALGATAVGIVLTALALSAAFLNAAFDFCLGCQAYLLIQRHLRVRPSA